MKMTRIETLNKFQTAAATIERQFQPESAALEIADGRYVVRLARNREEIEAAMRLRFEVFNLELEEGLESSHITGLDEDSFDAVCDHLIVSEKKSGAVVGTYRLQTLEMAGAAANFYCAGEFHLEDLPPTVLPQSLEIGRACVALEHRNARVLFLLWRGLAEYTRRTQKRYLFGCCSLTTQDAAEAAKALRRIAQNDAFHTTFHVAPRENCLCETANFADENIAEDWHLPKLFQTYLRFGAKVCSPPAIDREFKTIDFLVMFDFAAIDEKTAQMLLV